MLIGCRKLRRVAQRLEHFAVQIPGQIDLARIAVVEAQKQPMIGQRGYLGRMQSHGNHAAFFTRSSTRIPA